MKTRHPHQGFTLVELMMALALSSLLVAGLARIALSVTSGFRWQQGVSQSLQDAQFALDQLAREWRAAGFHPEPWTAAGWRSVEWSPVNGALTVHTLSRHNCYGSPNTITDPEGLPAWGLRSSHWQLNDAGALGWFCDFGPPTGPSVRQVNGLSLVEGVTQMTWELATTTPQGLRWTSAESMGDPGSIQALRIRLTVQAPGGQTPALNLQSSVVLRSRRP